MSYSRPEWKAVYDVVTTDGFSNPPGGFLIRRRFATAWQEWYHRQQRAWKPYRFDARPYKSRRGAERIMAQLQAWDALESWSKGG
jgi:hypothetical protein